MTMGKAFKQNRYSATALGDRPPGHLSYEGSLNPDQRAQNQDSWKKDRINGRVPILSGKWNYQAHIISPGDAEYIETARLNDQQIYGIFQLPPAFAQNYERMTWSNSEQADLVYAKHTVTNIVRVIEQECNKKLFTPKEKKNIFTKFNMNGLLRGDSKARAEFYTAMVQLGLMNRNEGRNLEDMNPYSDGNIFTTQAANIPIDLLRDFYTTKVIPKPKEHEKGEKNEKNGYHFSYQ
jgi:HK97 family phage portal protein